LNIVIAWNHEHGCRTLEFLHEQPRRLKLAVPRSQGQVSRDHRDIRLEIGNEVLDRRDLRQVGDIAKMDVRQMNDAKAHFVSSSLPLSHDPAYYQVAQHIPDRHAHDTDETNTIVRREWNKNVQAHGRRRQYRHDPRRAARALLDLPPAGPAELAERQFDGAVAARTFVLNQACV
jgi:hypothetical protein